jgi:hypothetical protein
MATDIVGSLFGVTPEVLQQRQMEMADRQAMEYAQLSPLQRASYGLARGGYQLAGALGGQDPQLRMISNRNAIARQVDYTNPESMASGVQALADAGDTVGAMQLSQVLRQAQSELAQRTQRLAAAQASLAAAGRERTEASPNDVRIAREFAAQKGEPGSPEYNAEFTAQLTRLTTKPEGAGPREVQLARELALRAGPVGSPEYTAAYNAELGRLTTPERAAESTPEIRNAAALASQKGQPGSPEYQAEFATQLARLTTKTEADRPTDAMRNADALALLKGPKGSPEYNAEYSTQLARLTTRETQTPELARLQALRDSYAPGSRERKEVQDRIDALGKGTGVSVTNVLPRQEAGVNKNKVELAGQVETTALSAPDRITLARNLRAFLPQAFTGLGSDVKLEASRFASALGIPVTGTTESQIIDQILGQMTIGAAGQLKGALSDKDREFLKQTIGTRGLTRSALEFVSQRIEREARIDERLNEAVQAWQKSGKSLNDFNFVTQRSEAARQIDADIKRLEELRRKQRGG